MRTLTVKIEVDHGIKTENKDGILMTAVNFSWPCGKPIPLSFENLCGIGLKTLFRRREITDGLIDIIIKDVDDLDEPVIRLNGIRGRRFYMKTENKKAYFCLCNGIKTDLNFHIEKEEEAVLNWLRPPQEGQIKWFDLIAC